MSQRQKKEQAAFTIIETMVAATVLGITIGACLYSFSMAMKIVDATDKQMDALHDARNQIEMLRTNDFTNAVFTAGTYAISNANFVGNYVVTDVDTWTKNIVVNSTYPNRIRGGNSTNTLMTSITTTLH